VDYLAITIAAVISLLDPDVIALGGGVARSADLLIAPIIQKLEGKVPHIPPIIASSLMHHSAVLGAMINLLHNTSDFYLVRKLT
jgi:predicted NBD/HSP70 family sugar kinase